MYGLEVWPAGISGPAPRAIAAQSVPILGHLIHGDASADEIKFPIPAPISPRPFT
jgi:hypothetical protein